MRHALIVSSAVLGAFALAAPSPLNAQAYTFVGGGLVAGADGGSAWLLSGGLGFPLGGGGFALGLEGNIGANGWSTLAGGQGFAAYRFGDRAKTGFFLLGGAGLYSDDGEGQPRFFLGGGMDIPLSTVGLFVEIRRAFWSSISTMWLTGGVTLPLGRRN